MNPAPPVIIRLCTAGLLQCDHNVSKSWVILSHLYGKEKHEPRIDHILRVEYNSATMKRRDIGASAKHLRPVYAFLILLSLVSIAAGTDPSEHRVSHTASSALTPRAFNRLSTKIEDPEKALARWAQPTTPTPVPTATRTAKATTTPIFSPTTTLTVTLTPTVATPTPTSSPTAEPSPTNTVAIAELPPTPTPNLTSAQEQLGTLTILIFVAMTLGIVVWSVVWLIRGRKNPEAD